MIVTFHPGLLDVQGVESCILRAVTYRMDSGVVVFQHHGAQKVELRIPSQLGWERTAMDVAASVAMSMGFPAQRIEDIKSAVAEATINAIEHGNTFNSSQMVLIVLSPEQKVLGIDVQDGSPVPFTPDHRLGDLPNLEDKLAGLDTPRGWGAFLIKSLVDEVEFSSSDDGNTVRMIIRLQV